MLYPDFSFYKSTQLILFFVNCGVTTISYYWGTNIIMEIYKKNVTRRQKMLFSFISAMLLNIAVIYGFYLFQRLTHKDGDFPNLLKIILPFAYFILYGLGTYIFKLTKYESIKIITKIYGYFVCCNTLLKIVEIFAFQKTFDIRGYNYLKDIYMLIVGSALIYIFTIGMRVFIKKNEFNVDFPNHNLTQNYSIDLCTNFFSCVVLYLLAESIYFNFHNNLMYTILVFVACIAYLAIMMLNEYIVILKNKQSNKDEHIASLHRSIDEFRGIKHDFNNILQSYSGYLQMDDMENLKVYHKSVVSSVIKMETDLKLSQRMQENPSFFSLLINKVEKAQKAAVIMEVVLLCKLDNIYIDELDFNRIMAILLDNAIEASEQTLSKRMSITGQTKQDGSKLLIISNDTTGEICVEQLFITGYTTKPGHMGQGLAQVQSTLHKYGNTTLHAEYYKNTFTLYFEIKPPAVAIS